MRTGANGCEYHIPRELSREVCHFLRHGGRSCEVIGRRNKETDWRCRVGAALIKKLEGLLQHQVTTS